MGKARAQERAELRRRAAEISVEAAQRPEAEREEFVRKATGEDAKLRKEVWAMLRAESHMADFLEAPAAARAALELKQGQGDKILPQGHIIEDYLILGHLGSGAFARVYHAHQISLGREVALKIGGSNGEEARKLAHLEHDNIVKVFNESVDPSKKQSLVCMQLIEGASLEKLINHACLNGTHFRYGRDLLREIDAIDVSENEPNELSPGGVDRETIESMDFTDAVLWIGLGLAEGLAYAHRRGIFHLDVKPANILINKQGRPFLTDFNVAIDRRPLQNGGTTTSFGGTFDYMSPEQREVFRATDRPAAIKRLDGRCDVYSLGTVLKELLTLGDGAPAWESRTQFSPRTLDVNAIVEKCVAKDPIQRYQSAEELVRALIGCLEARSMAKSIPAGGWPTWIIERYPLWCLLLGALATSLASVTLFHQYVAFRVVDTFTPWQQNFYFDLKPWVQPIQAALILAFWVVPVLRLRKRVPRAANWENDRGKLVATRRKILELPLWSIKAGGWTLLPVGLVIPSAFFLKSMGLTAFQTGQFFLAAGISGLIGVSFLFSLSQFIAIRALYPRFWWDGSEIRRQANNELRATGSRSRVFHLLMGFLPQLAAMVMVSQGVHLAVGAQRLNHALFILFLNALGIIGIMAGLRVTQQLIQTIFALTHGSSAVSGRINQLSGSSSPRSNSAS